MLIRRICQYSVRWAHDGRVRMRRTADRDKVATGRRFGEADQFEDQIDAA
jgi:hypothetical protein